MESPCNEPEAPDDVAELDLSGNEKTEVAARTVEVEPGLPGKRDVADHAPFRGDCPVGLELQRP